MTNQNKRTVRLMGAVGLGLVLIAVLLAGVIGLMPEREPPVAQAQGVTNWLAVPIEDGTTAYTGTQYLGSPTVADFGSVQIQVTSDVSSYVTSTVTIVPQFSNDYPARCGSAANWFTGTGSVIYTAQTVAIESSQVNTQTTTVVTNTSTITQEVGYIITSTTSTAAPALGSVTYSFGVTGDGTAGREFPILGRCMRLQVSVTNSDTYTPTIYLRLVDRQ